MIPKRSGGSAKAIRMWMASWRGVTMKALSPELEHDECHHDVEDVRVDAALLYPTSPRQETTQLVAYGQDEPIQDQIGSVRLEARRVREHPLERRAVDLR